MTGVLVTWALVGLALFAAAFAALVLVGRVTSLRVRRPEAPRALRGTVVTSGELPLEEDK